MVRVRCVSLPKGSIWQAIGERPWIGLGLALVVILLDQWSKQLAMDTLQFRQPEAVTSWFDWMLTYNTGAAFSFLAEAGGWQRWVLTGVAATVSVFIVIWLFRLAPSDRGLVLPLGLILGGAMGNLIDRVLLGHVVDFISLHYRGWYWPAFNVADSAITAGAAWWLGIALLGGSSPSEEAPVS